MKFACLGYFDQQAWDLKSQSERDATIEECFTYDDELSRQGHWLPGGQALQGTATAKTLRWKDGKVAVVDGPFAETKEVLGGLGVLEARDLDHAIAIMSRHPGIRLGPFEIRPMDEDVNQRQAELDRTTEAANPEKVGAIKFACMGYIDETAFDGVSPSEQSAMIEQCVQFDIARRRDGNWLSGIKLQGSNAAKTVRSNGGKAMVIDGPFAETKEQLGGLVVNQFRSMQHAVEVLSKHPALRFGVAIEVRPIDEEMNARWETRQRRVKK
jgi:hypothetical protein